MLPADACTALTDLARESIDHGADNGEPLPVRASDFPDVLQQKRASFVAIRTQGKLRGCVGTLYPTRSLAVDVAYNAYRSAFKDPRFSPVTSDQVCQLDLQISVLSSPVVAESESEAEVLSRVRPGIDGLILKEGAQCAILLPTVWGDVPEPAEFLRLLKLKAGLPPNYWSKDISLEYFSAESW